MKILIVPSNTDLNRGDQSLTWGSIKIAKEIDEDAEICLYKSGAKSLKHDEVNKQTEQLGYKILTRILLHPRREENDHEIKRNRLVYFTWGFRALRDIVVTLMLLSKWRWINRLAITRLSPEQKETYDYFVQLDIVLVKGGGFLHSYGSLFDPYVMYFQLFDIFLARKLGKKVIVLPNSIGPLKNSIARLIVKKALSKCSIVSTREGVSEQYVKQLGLPVLRSPDLGFYLKPSGKNFEEYLRSQELLSSFSQRVAITLRPYRFDGKANRLDLYKNYINQIKLVVEGLIQRKYVVSLVAHTIGPSAHEDDTIPLLDLYSFFKNNDNVNYLYDKSWNCRDVEKLYSYYDLVIGTRFHSVIFSLNVNTPAIAIAYGGNKAVGIMNDIGLSQFVVPIENPNAETILDRVGEVSDQKKEYLKKITNYKERLKQERSVLLNTIKSNLKKKRNDY